jgi:hypothetical protein
MATVAAVHSNSSIRAFYWPLLPNGKHAKPALTPGMRKPLVILDAMLRTKTHWQTSALATSSSTVSPLAGALNTVAASP